MSPDVALGLCAGGRAVLLVLEGDKAVRGPLGAMLPREIHVQDLQNGLRLVTL